MKFVRSLEKTIEGKFNTGKTIVLIGPRQTGKTTLIRDILSKKADYLFLDGDDITTRQLLENVNTQQLARILGEYKIVFIDQAQRINHIGLTVKIIHDQFENVQLILAGSSALDLNSQINEPLTGRKWQYQFYPISWQEFQSEIGYVASVQQLDDRLIYGMYPDVLNQIGNEEEVLMNLTASYLYKDILAITRIQKPEILEKLLQALAFQMGMEVSYNELAQLLGVNKETVSTYIQLLEKAFIVFRLGPLSRNLRNEIKTNRKIYFYDNGIRNAIISSFANIELRPDKGALWENFLISERIKLLHYQKKYYNYYFWRTKQQQEVDWVEERNQEFYGFEFKWKAKKNVKFPRSFVESYSAATEVISRDNFNDFLLDDGGV